MSSLARPSRAVLTLALGQPAYVQMALHLARSFLLWNPGPEITFHLVVDRPVRLPPDLSAVQLIPVEPGRHGSGFSPKLWLDELAPADQTLFLDSDCLCFGPLAPVFDRLAGQPVTVVGVLREQGEFFGDIARLRRVLQLPAVPVFVGAVYYLERTPVARMVYAEARRLERDYDALGLVRLRGSPNEEPLMALAMARHGLRPLPDDGSVKADAMYYRSVDQMDILRGIVRVSDPTPGKPVPSIAQPVVFHFNAYFTEGRHYRREVCRLECVRARGWNPAVATLYARLTRDYPRRIVDAAKNGLRPCYQAIFGARSVRRGPRGA
jgi:hypothetical protein